MTTLQYKIEFQGTLRRGSAPRGATLQEVQRSVAALLGTPTVVLQYRDQDQDLITIGSETEWAEVVREFQDKPLRLIVSEGRAGASTSAAEEAPRAATPPPPPEPEIPFAALAKALAQPETVAKIQAAAASPIVSDAVTNVAQIYLESKGDLGATGMAGANQLPLLMGLFNELMDEVPELKQASQQAFALGAEHFMGGGGGFHPFAGHGGPRFPHHGPPPHCGGPWNLKNVHPHVFCDGCQSDATLKRKSFAEGHITRRGNINGLRFKSKQVDDFDLCESCKATDRFPDRAYGPFETIQPPGFACGGGPRRWGGGPGGCWRAAAGQPTAAECKPAAASASSSAEKPFDFGEAIREAIVRGAEKVAEVTKDEDSEFSELAKAIAASLSGGDAAKQPAVVEKVPVVEASSSSAVSTSPKPEHEWETVPLVTESNDPFVKWGAQLHQLATLGFSDSETYVRFLEEEQGDLDRVVSRIVSREA